MKARITVDKKSLNKVLEKIEEIKSLVQNQMLGDLLNDCCAAIVRRSNEKLQLLDIGDNVKSEIAINWHTEKISTNKIALINSSDKSVYVEFGVGIVGQENPHEIADIAGYKYNMPSEYKHAGNYHDENTWRFKKKSKNDIDLQDGYYEEWMTKDGSLKIITRGSPSTMFVYNSVMDFANEQEAATIWAKIKKKYLG